MKKKMVLAMTVLALILSTYLAYAFIEYPRGRTLYVKVPTENLRAAPGGDKLGSLHKGTSMVVLEDTPDWVKVRLEGWIWKKSVTDSRFALSGQGYRALQIIVKDRAKAEDILRQLKAGADFGTLAKKYSVGPAASRGGDLGYFKKGDFQPEFENVILKLKPGEISEIVQSKLGYHIFRRED
ncbi:MAG: peptidylprolyl isomerase [bacterium]